jgi:hypothetical protein
VQGRRTMATRPAQNFVWAESGSKVDPGAPKKDLGFVVAERPPASWFNFLFNLIAQWLAYLIDRSDASIELPITMTTVIRVSGTWNVGSTGQLSESANGSNCRVEFCVPVGVTITNFKVRVLTGSGGTSQISAALTEIEPSASTIESAVDSTGTSATVDVAPAAPFAYVTEVNKRYGIAISTIGGGATARIIKGIWVTYSPAT